DRAEISGLGGPHPLSRIERRRIEDARRFLAVAPLAIAEGVDAEMQEQRELVTLPLQLRHRRSGQGHGERRHWRATHDAAGEGGRRQRNERSPRKVARPAHRRTAIAVAQPGMGQLAITLRVDRSTITTVDEWATVSGD